ncbi:hypothetical protein [Lysobacter sp. Root96]|uniref:hypothetical protein n=1 Tax=Lysobacter sp. Root96 TaxID=1736612 RepID=UPI000A96B0F9|nr:hypothetical protein [Lysobacter sp. Root96]
MEDTEMNALFTALTAMAVALHMKGVMDASDYLARLAAAAEGAGHSGRPTIEEALKRHALHTAGFLGNLQSSPTQPAH